MKWWQSAVLRVVLTTFGTLITFLPRKLELVLGPRLGLFLLRIDRKRRAIALDNISKCFPQLSSEEHYRLLEKNYRHYGILVFELLHLFSPFPGHYRRYVETNTIFEGFEYWQEAYAQGKGVLFVSSHLANWELMVGGGGLRGIPITMVTKHLKPEWLHKKIEAQRKSVKVRGAYEPRTLPVILRALRAKEAVGFVMDQYAGPPIGILVPFFGVQVGTLAAVGTLAGRTGAVVLPVRTYRDEQGVVHVCIERPFTQLASDEETTAILAARVEAWVRQTPDQWLWIHRRFKNVVWPTKLL